ncbi:MAG: glycosyltransferase family 2 protein [Bacteroides sp.]|nr:glycosyltransferase family 2 protein [Bacteroides sp.]
MVPIKISIVIPIYNVEKYVERCLNSVINQTMTEGVECLIIDDCSPDKSMDIVMDIIQRNRHSNMQFRILRNEQNKGIAYVRNLGIIESRGEYLTYLDSDDYCEPYTLEAMYNLAEKNNADMVIADYYVHSNSNIEYCKQSVPLNWIERFRANLSDDLKGFLWNKLVRKSLYINNNISYLAGINFGEDFLISLKLFYYSKNVSHLMKPCVHYMQDNLGSYSRSLSKRSLEDIIACEKELMDFLEERSLTQSVKDEVNMIRLRNLNQLIFRTTGKLQREWVLPYRNLGVSAISKNKNLIPSLYWRIALSCYFCGSLFLYNQMRSLWRLLRKKQSQRIPLYK